MKSPETAGGTVEMKNRSGNRITVGMLSLFILFAGTLFLQCDGPKDEHAAETESEEHGHSRDNGDHESGEEETVRLSEAELEEFGVVIATAGEGNLMQHIDLTGEIVIDPGRLAHIVPRFPGIVLEVHKKIGDHVRKGDVLVIIESNESLAPYEVKSLVEGTVIDRHLTLGEVVTDESHAFLIADISVIWANFSVYQNDLPQISIGRKAVVTAGQDLHEAVGEISYISPVVDEKTRTATARVVLSNRDGQWKPGTFVSATVEAGNMAIPILVHKTALYSFEGRTVVFSKTVDGFKPNPVTTGRSNDEFVEIVSGLHAGQEYAASGGFIIKAEFQKEAFGDGHGH